ncbi:MAG: hypothetical protein V1821_01005 [bacterium]
MPELPSLASLVRELGLGRLAVAKGPGSLEWKEADDHELDHAFKEARSDGRDFPLRRFRYQNPIDGPHGLVNVRKRVLNVGVVEMVDVGWKGEQPVIRVRWLKAHSGRTRAALTFDELRQLFRKQS